MPTPSTFPYNAALTGPGEFDIPDIFQPSSANALWVDSNAPALPAPTGSIGNPFLSIAAAFAAIGNSDLAGWTDASKQGFVVVVLPGSGYSESPTVPVRPGVTVVFLGPVAMVGTFQMGGDYTAIIGALGSAQPEFSLVGLADTGIFGGKASIAGGVAVNATPAATQPKVTVRNMSLFSGGGAAGIGFVIPYTPGGGSVEAIESSVGGNGVTCMTGGSVGVRGYLSSFQQLGSGGGGLVTPTSLRDCTVNNVWLTGAGNCSWVDTSFTSATITGFPTIVADAYSWNSLEFANGGSLPGSLVTLATFQDAAFAVAVAATPGVTFPDGSDTNVQAAIDQLAGGSLSAGQRVNAFFAGNSTVAGAVSNLFEFPVLPAGAVISGYFVVSGCVNGSAAGFSAMVNFMGHSHTSALTVDDSGTSTYTHSYGIATTGNIALAIVGSRFWLQWSGGTFGGQLSWRGEFSIAAA